MRLRLLWEMIGLGWVLGEELLLWEGMWLNEEGLELGRIDELSVEREGRVEETSKVERLVGVLEKEEREWFGDGVGEMGGDGVHLEEISADDVMEGFKLEINHDVLHVVLDIVFKSFQLDIIALELLLITLNLLLNTLHVFSKLLTQLLLQLNQLLLILRECEVETIELL
jgi:hypothetical protein